MKFPAAVALALLTLPALAGPPTLDALEGEWWDEAGQMKLGIGPDGTGSLLDCPSQTIQLGPLAMLENGKLTFSPQGKPVTEWTASMDGEFLVLARAGAGSLRCRRETRGARTDRLGRMLAELAGVAGPPAAREQRRERALKIRAEAEPVILSLAGSDVKAQENLLKGLLAENAPAALETLKELEGLRLSSKELSCMNNLKEIGCDLLLYESRNEGYPETLDGIRTKDLASDPRLFHCPASGKDDAYVYIFPGKGDETPGDAVIAHDRDPHPNGLRCVLTFQGTVLKLDGEEFRKALTDGVRNLQPRIAISSAEIVETKGRRELVVKGTVSGLRVAESDGQKVVRATVKLMRYPVGGRQLESEGVPLEGPAKDQPLSFSLRLDMGDADEAFVRLKDEVRGDSFSQAVEFKK